MRMKRKAEDRDREVIEERPTILPNLIPGNIGFINSYIGRPAGVLEFSSSEVIGGQCLIVLTESLAPRLQSLLLTIPRSTASIPEEGKEASYPVQA